MSRGLWQALFGILALATTAPLAAQEGSQVRLGVIGLTHTHVHWILESAKKRNEFKIVGIVEPDQALAERYAKQHGFDMGLVYDDLDAMLDAAKPEGVTAFGTIRDHLALVQAAAPRGIHVLVEKPLAVSLEHARAMADLARRHEIHLLTNYETSWYPSHHAAVAAVSSGAIGDLRKLVFHHGHEGPHALGINREFLDWLVDPYYNGAGALTDFGCYGANLAVWLMAGQRPNTVTAVTQQFQPEHYPEVDDEATIIVAWDDAQAIIQASWNWPFSRKDMALYGTGGQLIAPDGETLERRSAENRPAEVLSSPRLEPPGDDPFVWFASVIRGETVVSPFSPGALENNLLVMEILQAAMDSARQGETVRLEP